MNKNKISIQMIKYELRNVAGNPFVHIFGVGFPIFLMIVISKSITSDVGSASYVKEVVTSIFLGVGAIIPMATILMGYSSTCSQDIEKEIPLRMKLFGFSERFTIINRLLAEMFYMSCAFVLYFIAGFTFVDLYVPSVSGVLIYMFCIYIFAAIMFIMAHAIANLVKKFGLTYLISMLLYFGMMLLGGMMGIQTDQLPKGLQSVSDLMPFTYFNRDFYKAWQGKSYNYVPMIQAYIFFLAISGILIFIMNYRAKRNLH